MPLVSICHDDCRFAVGIYRNGTDEREASGSTNKQDVERVGPMGGFDQIKLYEWQGYRAPNDGWGEDPINYWEPNDFEGSPDA